VTTLVVGLGNPDRGDDAAGWLVADLLDGRDDLVVRRVRGDVSSLLDDPAWSTADRVVAVDAVVTGAPPGTVATWSSGELGARQVAPRDGAHDLDLVTTLDLARALGRLPTDLSVIGIEGGCFDVGAPPSPAVVDAAGRVVGALRAGGA
jgi:hydrogenase maturation protease